MAETTHPSVLTEPDAGQVKAAVEKEGYALVRGADVSLEQFEALSDALMMPMVHQATRTVERDRVNEDGTTSTVNKGTDFVPYHREGSYAPGCPHLLAFYCVTPPTDGGQTMLCDGVRLRENLSDPVREFVDGAMLKWRWWAKPDRWQATLGTDDKEEALRRVAGLRDLLPSYESVEDVRFDGDILEGRFISAAVIPTRWGGHRSFCNSTMIYYYREASSYFAKDAELSLVDGSAFPPDMLEEISAEAERLTEDVAWEPTDVLIVDNSRFMHGRRAFGDPSRRILVRMGYVR